MAQSQVSFRRIVDEVLMLHWFELVEIAQRTTHEAKHLI